MNTYTTLEHLKKIAHGLTLQFGQNCEVVIHDLRGRSLDNTVVFIENGHISGRQVGDGPSHVVLEARGKKASEIEDRYGYLTRTKDGRNLKSTTIFMGNPDTDHVDYVLSINYDITSLMTVDAAVRSIITTGEEETRRKQPERITQNVNDLLDDLIEQSVDLVGKPVALMSKDEKVTAIRFLNDAGAFLITKSGDKVSKFFGISKYTLYSYIDVNNNKSKTT